MSSNMREKFSTKLGFILVSAGCAVGLGNVWKFPYICGNYGGGAFILIYLFFLLILGLPSMICEYTVGRASQASVATSYEKLEPKGTFWHKFKFLQIGANYILMAFYTVICGWILYYCVKTFAGNFTNVSSDTVENIFGNLLGDWTTMIIWTLLSCFIGMGICFIGLKNGVEKITKIMMILLFVIMIFLAIYIIFFTNSTEGLKFYLIPNWERTVKNGIGNALFAALSHAFFTLSIGIGTMQILGSYLDKKHNIVKESCVVAILDTLVALIAGLIIIPSCFAYGVQPNAGPSLIFVTLPNIFAKMKFGNIIGGFFFLFLSFAALSTLISVYETLIGSNSDLFGWSRKKSTLINTGIIAVIVLPCIFGFNLLSGIHPFGPDSNILDLEDFIVSNNLLPLGGMYYALFCSTKNGWEYDIFLQEFNGGKKSKFTKFLQYYLKYGVTSIILFIYIKGYYDILVKCPLHIQIIWGIAAICLLSFIFGIVFTKKKAKED